MAFTGFQSCLWPDPGGRQLLGAGEMVSVSVCNRTLGPLCPPRAWSPWCALGSPLTWER